MIFCRVLLQFLMPVTCDPRIVTQMKETIAQQWQMAVPATAFPPTNCQDAMVASI